MMSKTPVDRSESPSEYLLKILTILVKRSSGEIRIDATDMMDDDNIPTLVKSYDRERKQLVLSFLAPGFEIFNSPNKDPNKEVDQWQPKVNGKQRSSQVQPLLRSDLMDSLTSGQPVQPDNQPVQRSAAMTDEQLADLEDRYRVQRAAQLISNFPSTPVTHPRSEPLQPRLINPQRQPRSVQPAYYKD